MRGPNDGNFSGRKKRRMSPKGGEKRTEIKLRSGERNSLQKTVSCGQQANDQGQLRKGRFASEPKKTGAFRKGGGVLWERKGKAATREGVFTKLGNKPDASD